MEIEEKKRIEYIVTGFRWILVLFVFFLIPMNLQGSREERTVIINTLFIFLLYSIGYISFFYILVRLSKEEKSLDKITLVSVVFDMIAIMLGASVIFKVCDLPIELGYIILQITILARYRTSFLSLISNGIILLCMWIFQLTFGVQYYRDLWHYRGIIWSMAIVFNMLILWHIFRNYNELLEHKELGNLYLAHSKQSIDQLVHVNKISAALNASLSQNEIIKILLKNISQMAGSDDCAVLLYSKREGEGYLYRYKEFKSFRKELDPIGYESVCIGEEIKKIKSMKEYKNMIDSYQPVYMADLVNIYNIDTAVLNPRKKWLYMFKIMCSMKEGGFLIIAADHQFESEVGQLISLLVGQAGTALSTAVLYNSVKRKANTDPLTGVKTRRYLKEFLRKEIERSKRYNKRFCLLFFDIDNFKLFNDEYGHKIGDEVLKSICKIVQSTVRKIDLIVRYGGEEFVVILPETQFEDGYRIAERIRMNIESYSLKEKFGVNRAITVSIGIAEYGVDGVTEEELISYADCGMYQAKSNGKNQVCSFRDDQGMGKHTDGSNENCIYKTNLMKEDLS